MVDVGAEDPVERAGGETVEGELELQRRHVPALDPAVEGSRPERMTREAAERPARLWPWNAVDRDPSVALQPAYRASGRRA
jgi:hypothetical protein